MFRFTLFAFDTTSSAATQDLSCTMKFCIWDGTTRFYYQILFNYALDYLNGRLVTCAHLRYGSHLIHKRAFIHSKPEFLGNSLIFQIKAPKLDLTLKSKYDTEVSQIIIYNNIMKGRPSPPP